MVKASRPAASQFNAMPISMTENIDSTTPSAGASAPCTRPAGTGRPRVRLILASMSASYHMLSAPDAPAPTAMQRIATAARNGCSAWPAQTKPVRAVNTTSDITRGFMSCTKSCQRAGAAVERAGDMAIGRYSKMIEGREPVPPLSRRRRGRGNAPLYGRGGGGAGRPRPPLVDVGLDHRQLAELVERRRRWQGPLKRRGGCPPRVDLTLA